MKSLTSPKMPDPITGKTTDRKPRWLLMLAIIFFVLLGVAGAGLIIFDNAFKHRIYANIYIGNLNLGGKSAEEASRLLNQKIDKINQRGIIFSYKNQRAAITPVISSADGDLAYQIISFNADQAVAAALNYGRSGNVFADIKNKLLALIAKKQLSISVLVNQEAIIKILKNNFTQGYEPARDASLVIKKVRPAGVFEFSVAKEKLGKAIDYEDAIGRLLANLSKLDPAEIRLFTVTEYPKILTQDALNIETKAEALLSQAPLTLSYSHDKWIIDQDQLAGFLALKPSNAAQDKINVGLDDNKFKDYLKKEIAPEIDKKPIEAKFAISDGKVTEFQSSQDGQTLNLEASITKIENEMAATSSIGLVLEPRPSLITTGNINNFGIKETVGVGRSDFTGSPPNRRHNIKIGGAAINGLLIKPGEEFSLLKALGEVSAKTGYLPELVIKENKTIPEYGGGLCQVGTTMFRAALERGLPITMRRNHSYRVQYYEPAGTDATIYDPWPDFRFINDMPTYILIQTKIATNTLAFEFWGERDGRLAEKTKPTIYNIVKSEPTKIIETLDLKPGETKCTERAHNGADAYFDYKVTYPDGQIKEKRFSSHYVPWREVCLLGVEKLSSSPGTAASIDSGQATS